MTQVFYNFKSQSPNNYTSSNVIPYGVLNGLAVFQYCMPKVLYGLQSGYSKKMYISDYLDVVIIFFRFIL